MENLIQLASADDTRPITQRLMTIEEIQKATAWVNDKSVREGDPCQVCGSTHSLVEPSLGPMPGGINPYDGVTGWLHPAVVVTCQNCGFMRYFNAVIVGLMKGYVPSSGDENA